MEPTSQGADINLIPSSSPCSDCEHWSETEPLGFIKCWVSAWKTYFWSPRQDPNFSDSLTNLSCGWSLTFLCWKLWKRWQCLWSCESSKCSLLSSGSGVLSLPDSVHYTGALSLQTVLFAALEGMTWTVLSCLLSSWMSTYTIQWKRSFPWDFTSF